MRIRFKVVLELYRKTVSELIVFANDVVDKMNANTFFPVPLIALADISTASDDLSIAASNALHGGDVETAILTVKRIALENLLTAEGQYVETVANDPANMVPLDQPVQIIESAGMTVKRVAIHQKQIFAVMAGVLAGTVKVTAEAVKRGFHEWQMTTTPDDESSWTNLPSTTKAKILITGLTSGLRVYVRERSVLKSGPQNWTNAESVIVP